MSRTDDLLALFTKHQHSYDSDCGYDGGCMADCYTVDNRVMVRGVPTPDDQFAAHMVEVIERFLDGRPDLPDTVIEVEVTPKKPERTAELSPDGEYLILGPAS